MIFGGIGRSYDRDLYESLQVEQTKSVLSQPQLMFNTPVKPCTVGINNCYAWDPRYLDISTLQALVAGTTAGKEVDMVNNNLKAPYSDQFSIGMRNKIGDWNTSATIARILSYDGLVFTLGDRYPDGSFWQNGSQPFGNGIPGFGAMIIGNNGLETRTTQVLLEADKPSPMNPAGARRSPITPTRHAKLQNNDNQDPTDQYAFHYETIGNYPFTSAGVAKNRLVATGSFAGWSMGLPVRRQADPCPRRFPISTTPAMEHRPRIRTPTVFQAPVAVRCRSYRRATGVF